MVVRVVDIDPQYILNHCTKYLARNNTDLRHNFGQFPSNASRGQIAESWRFPIIDTYSEGIDSTANYGFNRVTFIYQNDRGTLAKKINVIGTFANLYEPIPLQPIDFLGEETGYYALTTVVPKGEVHRYQYIVDDRLTLDPINPQTITLDNGKVWSRFFTQYCNQPLTFEDWEYGILQRLVNYILPFRTQEGQNFVDRYYNYLDDRDKDGLYPYAYRLDKSVGATNYIDCILAREENHHLPDYKICIGEIDRVLRQRNPYLYPQDMPDGQYGQLYNEMAMDKVSGWNYTQYGSPKYFWELLRRHTYTGAFAHPKYGGNIGGAGWAYLAERYRDKTTNETLFNWRNTIEAPLGLNREYHG